MTLAVERSESFYFLRSSFLALFLAFNALVSLIQHCKFSLSQNFLIAVDISGLDKKLCQCRFYLRQIHVMSKIAKNIGDKTSTNAIVTSLRNSTVILLGNNN